MADRPPFTLYLDQSDLSYLAKRRGPTGTDYAVLRDRVRELSDRGVIALRLSFLHLYESLRLDPKQFDDGLRFLRSLKGVRFYKPAPEGIYRAEFDFPDVERRLDDWALAELDGGQFDWRLRLIGRAMPYLQRLEAWAHRSAQQSELSTRKRIGKEQHERRLRSLFGLDPSLLLTKKERKAGQVPLLRDRLALGLASGPITLLRRMGFFHAGDTSNQVRQQHNGLSWVAWLGPENVRRAVELAPGWRSKEAAKMPASALRTAADAFATANFQTDPSAGVDALHLAYIAYCDAATADKRIIEATREVRKHLARPRWIRQPGQLAALLDEIEDAWKAAAC